jgi:hypothetical protein
MKVRTGVTAPGAWDRARMARRFGAPRPALDRGVCLPDSRSAHRDDVRAELEHGRIGASRRDVAPMGLGLWTLLMVMLAVALVAVSLLVTL